MRRISMFGLTASVTLALFGAALPVSHAYAVSTYTLNLTVIDEDAATNVGLYDDEGDQGASHGRRTCAEAKLMWLNPDPMSTSDIVKYQRVGNRTKVKVKNDGGKTVGLGTLSKVSWIKDRAVQDEDPEIGTIVYGTCTYSQSIKVKASDFYSIELIGVKADPFDISLTDLKKKKWKLTLTV